VADTSGNNYRERLKRIEDAVQLKVPDRVPTLVDFGYFAAKYGGITVEDAFYDKVKWAQAYKKAVVDFQPDMFHALLFFPGAAYEAVDTRVIKWPGHGVPSDQSMQFVEGEYMTGDEYDALMEDPSDFIIRTYLPRTATALAPLQRLPRLSALAGLASGFVPPMLSAPDVIAACEAIYKAGKASTEWFFGARLALVKEMEELGFTSIYQAAMANNPFELIANSLRGMRGSMLDMYRQPEKLLQAINKLLAISLKGAGAMPPMGPNNVCWMAALRGADGFMSLKQFEKFYWPSMKAIIEATVNAGFIPSILWEGDFTSRLEYLLELPKGKVINRFDRTDIFKAKEVLGGQQCIAGGIPASLLTTGTVQDVKDRCKKLIDVVGKDGGYIMSHGCQMDNLRPENLKAMIDFAREYGVYR
jgi:hypothetical protein